MLRSKDPCILVLLLITTKEIPQTRIYDRHRFCGKSVVEIQKHSQKHNRFTTENKPMVVTTDIIPMVDSVVNLS